MTNSMIPQDLVDAINALPNCVRVTERKTRKDMTCKMCMVKISNGEVVESYIHKGESYASVTYGMGLGAIKFPDRVHISCLPAYIERERAKQL